MWLGRRSTCDIASVLQVVASERQVGSDERGRLYQLVTPIGHGTEGLQHAAEKAPCEQPIIPDQSPLCPAKLLFRAATTVANAIKAEFVMTYKNVLRPSHRPRCRKKLRRPVVVTKVGEDQTRIRWRGLRTSRTTSLNSGNENPKGRDRSTKQHPLQ
jgi:hypothetical protein